MNIKIENKSKCDGGALDKAKAIAKEFNVPLEVGKVLVAKGIDTSEEVEKFLFVSKDNLYDPYLLSGMRAVTERIEQAIDNDEVIVVYGDYDADGICGAYILTKGIRDMGGNAIPYIPNRSAGYGLNISGIEEVIEEHNPDLIVTVDLGISCYGEVEYIKDLGIDVLVSDHHELPPLLPDCDKINPKLDEGQYPFTDLCGAGVALKIMQAMSPNKYMDYIEYAAIATVADSVSLKDENRAIVKLGLEKINENPSVPLQILMKECGVKGEVTSTTLAFVLAPRINASGRMGDAKRSLDLFLAEEKELIKEMVVNINKDNTLRQKGCEDIMQDGYNHFIKDSKRYAVLLKSDHWQSGLLGIVASKLAEEFCRPTILFVEHEGSLRGSGRSIDGINMFEMLSTMKDLFVTFGGHSQACGLTMKVENFEIFQERVEEYLKANTDKQVFIPTAHYDLDEADSKPTMELVKALDILEPYGVGNSKPIFMRKEKIMAMSPMKNYQQHLVGEGSMSELLAFSQGKYVDVFRSDAEKAVFVDYSINSFRGKDSVRGNIKEFFSVATIDNLPKENLTLDYLFNLDASKNFSLIDEESVKNIVNKDTFGVLIIANTSQGLSRVKRILSKDEYLFETNAIVIKSNLNKVLVSPKNNLNFAKYHTIIFVESFSTIDLPKECAGSKIFSLRDDSYSSIIESKREHFVEVYKALRNMHGMKIYSYQSVLNNLQFVNLPDIDKMYAYAVFKELGLFIINNDRIEIKQGMKVELSDSNLYRGLML